MADRDPLEYVLNQVEHAGSQTNPAKHGYGDRRRELLDGISDLRLENERLKKALEEKREDAQRKAFYEGWGFGSRTTQSFPVRLQPARDADWESSETREALASDCPGCTGLRSKVAELEAEVRRAYESDQWSCCIECGFGVSVDEDGCCVSCGQDAMRYTQAVHDSRALRTENERLKKALGIAQGGLWGIRDRCEAEASKVASDTIAEIDSALSPESAG